MYLIFDEERTRLLLALSQQMDCLRRCLDVLEDDSEATHFNSYLEKQVTLAQNYANSVSSSIECLGEVPVVWIPSLCKHLRENQKGL